MLRVEEAVAAVIGEATPLPPIEGPLREILGCVLAEHVEADADQPPFDKALVDGYAVRVDDLKQSDGRLRIGETILAGRPPTRPLGPGEAAAIMTGAPLPALADAVVMLEHTRCDSGELIIEGSGPRSGQNILRQGRVYQQGDILLRPGTVLSPTCLGLLASVGRTRVRVIPRPGLAILPTGDELVAADQRPGPGQIRNSNAIMLEELAQEHGTCPRALPITPDDADELSRMVRECLSFDVLLITGGVSAGQRDLVPAALERSGVRRVFHKVSIKPGKPLWFGVGPRRGERPGTLVFGLPGNPASTLVGFLVFVRPALDLLAGLQAPPVLERWARLGCEYHQRGDRETYSPARWLQPPQAETGTPATIDLLDWAGSADLLGMALADGFAIFPVGDRVFEAGEIVRFLPLR